MEYIHFVFGTLYDNFPDANNEHYGVVQFDPVAQLMDRYKDAEQDDLGRKCFYDTIFDSYGGDYYNFADALHKINDIVDFRQEYKKLKLGKPIMICDVSFDHYFVVMKSKNQTMTKSEQEKFDYTNRKHLTRGY